jgi:hypothetical protein
VTRPGRFSTATAQPACSGQTRARKGERVVSKIPRSAGRGWMQRFFHGRHVSCAASAGWVINSPGRPKSKSGEDEDPCPSTYCRARAVNTQIMGTLDPGWRSAFHTGPCAKRRDEWSAGIVVEWATSARMIGAAPGVLACHDRSRAHIGRPIYRNGRLEDEMEAVVEADADQHLPHGTSPVPDSRKRDGTASRRGAHNIAGP